MRASPIFTLTLVAGLAACTGSTQLGPPWLEDAHIRVPGVGVTNTDCRTAICQHNENTDLTLFGGATFLVHRTAESQILGPNSALHVYRSADHGAHFVEVAILQAPPDRDLRDPSFYTVGNLLYLKALTRLPVTSARDANVDTITVAFSSTDGMSWQNAGTIGPEGWSYWRVREQNGVYYSAAYADGDLKVALFSSTNGLTWTKGPDIYTVSDDTPLETELTFLPSGTLLALVRTDGNDQELLGDAGRLRTQVCRAQPPYASFACTDVLDGVRLDGPLSFLWQDRLFVVARKHLQGTLRKRTALYEITGDLDHGPVAWKEWGELPSAGDTSYAGGVPVGDHRELVTWYSGDLSLDENWVAGILDATDIWQGVIDLSKLK